MNGTRRELVGGTVLWPDGRLAPGTLVLDGDRVAALHQPGQRPAAGRAAGTTVTDVSGCVVAPGFVDTHVHGALGANFMAADPDATDEAAARLISSHLARGGVTSCVAATASVDLTRLTRSLRGLAGMRGRLGGDGVELVGIHLEGPFLSADFRGVHRPEYLLSPRPEFVDAVLSAGGDALRIVTLAPELPFGLRAVAELTAAGVRVSMGHSAATYGQAVEAIEAGVRRATHLFNGLPPIHHRQPGPVPALLTDDRVHCELVADGVHVAPEMIRFAAEVAGTHRIVLVSDGADVSGLPPGRHHRWEGTEVEVTNQGARTLGGSVAGSVARLGDAVRTAVQAAGVEVADALRMASANPADSLGLTDRGRFVPGTLADVVILDPELDVRTTIVRGDIVHHREEHS
ncbi:MAG TPA: N-acetylglucosamine-6-phosphate deacetylase [Jiangellaceae bacterium]